jgi:hypothetical protein
MKNSQTETNAVLRKSPSRPQPTPAQEQLLAKINERYEELLAVIDKLLVEANIPVIVDSIDFKLTSSAAPAPRRKCDRVVICGDGVLRCSTRCDDRLT